MGSRSTRRTSGRLRGRRMLPNPGWTQRAPDRMCSRTSGICTLPRKTWMWCSSLACRTPCYIRKYTMVSHHPHRNKLYYKTNCAFSYNTYILHTCIDTLIHTLQFLLKFMSRSLERKYTYTYTYIQYTYGTYIRRNMKTS